MTPAERRARTLERLASQRFDLLVVGAGIIGSRIAYDAARAGMSVALIDAGDFGCATSSASSKFIHGGLRYLTMGSVRLDIARFLSEGGPIKCRPYEVSAQ